MYFVTLRQKKKLLIFNNIHWVRWIAKRENRNFAHTNLYRTVFLENSLIPTNNLTAQSSLNYRNTKTTLLFCSEATIRFWTSHFQNTIVLCYESITKEIDKCFPLRIEIVFRGSLVSLFPHKRGQVLGNRCTDLPTASGVALKCLDCLAKVTFA